MSKLHLKPWEMGEERASTGIPALCTTEQMCVKLACPKNKTVRDGLVAYFLMTSYFNSDGKQIETVIVQEDPSGYKISFPLGKTGLISTKYRGPKSYYKFQDNKSGSFYEIPQSKFTVEAATTECADKVGGWSDLSDEDKALHIDEYFASMFNFGMSQDLMLPIEGDDFTDPAVGITTKLYRVYTPPSEGEKYGNVIITKWKRGLPNLDGEFKVNPEPLAVAAYEEYQKRDNVETKFDPTTFVEDEGDDVI